MSLTYLLKLPFSKSHLQKKYGTFSKKGQEVLNGNFNRMYLAFLLSEYVKLMMSTEGISKTGKIVFNYFTFKILVSFHEEFLNSALLTTRILYFRNYQKIEVHHKRR